jgi:hypothetical protein
MTHNADIALTRRQLAILGVASLALPASAQQDWTPT